MRLLHNSENVVVLDDDIALVDADAKLDALVFRDGGVALGHAALHRGREGDRLDNAWKLYQHAVARGLDDAPWCSAILDLSPRRELPRAVSEYHSHQRRSAANSPRHRRPGSQRAGGSGSCRFARRQAQAGQPKLAVLGVPQGASVRYHDRSNSPQPLDDLSCVVESTHMRVAGGEIAIWLRAAWILVDREE